MIFKQKILTKADLQLKMTVYVTSAVLFVSAVILFILTSFIRGDYEQLLNDRITDDLAAITQNIEQRMERVENVTTSMASVIPLIVDNKREIDSLLYNTAKSMEDVRCVSMLFDKGYDSKNDGYVERMAYFDDNHDIQLTTYINGEEFVGTPSWNIVLKGGKSLWLGPVKEYYTEALVVVYFVPFYNTKHERIGMIYSELRLSYLTSFVTQHKVRKDIDISIYSKEGAEFVAPDEYIRHVAPQNLIVRESHIEHLGWKVVCSADRKIINTAVRNALLTILFIIILLFLVITFVIWYTVKHIAQPFVQKQQRIEKEKAVMDSELQLAASAQKELVPHIFPPFTGCEGVDISACLNPARNVGGDLYDYFIQEDKLHFCIGDVSGKGIQASLFMSATHYLFRIVATAKTPANAVEYINRSLCSDNEQCRFVTFWYGCLNLCSGELEYVNAGHDAPIMLRNGKAELLPMAENMPLGVLEDAEFVSKKINLEKDDIILLYTDGVTEAMNVSGKEFGRQSVVEAVGKSPSLETSVVLENVYKRVQQHAAGAIQSDDITMLCFKFLHKK